MTPLEATKQELEAAGIAYEIAGGKRHDKVRFKVRGQGCIVTCSRSTSDHRASLNARHEVRRAIRRALELEK
jgi:hypothetical protein